MSLEIVKNNFQSLQLLFPFLHLAHRRVCMRACTQPHPPTHTLRVSWQVSVGKFEKRVLLVIHNVSKHPRTSTELS